MIRIVLNGEEVPPEQVAGEPDLKTTTEIEGEDGASLLKSVSGELTFYGRAWEIIRDQLITPTDGKLREVPILIFDDCPDASDFQTFSGVVRGDLLKWCHGECFVRTTVLEKTETSKAMDCIKSTLIFDNWNGFQQQDHPRMRYCDEIRPIFIHQTILVMGQFLLLTLDVLTPLVLVITGIVTILNLIIDAVNLIPGVNIDHIDFDGDADTNTFEEWQSMRAKLQETIIGCGRAHPSPLVRSYIANVCGKCGIAFQSTILNNPSSDYWNMVLWHALVEKGTRDDNVKWIDSNRPIMSGDQFLDRLKVVFNARYGIRTIAGVPTLVFERRDRLQGGNVWVDYDTLKAQGRITEPLCFTYSSENPAAYAVIGFSEDGMDEPGNEARNFYKDIIEWNQPFNAGQTKSKEKQFQFGMSRNRRDGIGIDVLDDWVVYPSLQTVANQYGHAMMVSRGIAMLPKLLIWNGDLLEGNVQRGYDPGGDGGVAFGKPPAELYNFPLNVSEFNVPTNTALNPDTPNADLYGRFHAIDAPKVNGELGRDWSFEFQYTAADLASMDLFADVGLPIGLGRQVRTTINHSKGTILVAGKV